MKNDPDISPYRLKSYEMRCKNYSSVQEYIDSLEVHKEIERFKATSAFRYNFFANISRALWHKDFSENRTLNDEVFIGINCYADIIYSMMLGINRKDADRLVRGYIVFEEEIELRNISSAEEDNLHYSQAYPEINRDLTEGLFMNYMRNTVNEKYWIPEDIKESEKNEKKLLEVKKELKSRLAPKIEEQKLFFEKYNNKVEELKQDGEKVDLRELFSKEQIISWVNDNILMPQDETEEYYQELMIKWLDEYRPAREYFMFPMEWEDNGIADIVREAYGITDVMQKYKNEKYGEYIYDEDIFNYWWIDFELYKDLERE